MKNKFCIKENILKMRWKRNKKIIAMILCVVQIFSMQTTVFATEAIQETTANEMSIEVTADEILVWSREDEAAGLHVPGIKVSHNGQVWLQVSNETSSWNEPGSNDNVWQIVSDAENEVEIKAWEQSYAVEHGYVVGSKVIHNDKTWEQVWDRTCWWEEPGTDDNIWIEVSEAPELDLNDDDGDGLPNYFEDEIGIDKNNPDTDGDGLTDGEEISKTGTDPTKADTDGNGVNDGDEDIDADGMTNLEEKELGTDIAYNDTDFDGLLDGKEVELGTDPLKADSDNDGLSDGDELTYNLDPLNPDTLGDEILDGDRTFEVTLDTDFEEVSDPVKVDVAINGTAEEIKHSAVEQVTEDGVFYQTECRGIWATQWILPCQMELRQT